MNKATVFSIMLFASVSVAAETADARIDAAHQLVERKLKDPSSVQYRKVRFIDDEAAVCGEFNAKNSYGGYVGFKPFVVDGSGKIFVMDENGGMPAATAILNLCFKDGAPR